MKFQLESVLSSEWDEESGKMPKGGGETLNRDAVAERL